MVSWQAFEARKTRSIRGSAVPYHIQTRNMEVDLVDVHPWHVLSLCSGYGGLDLAVKLAVPSARTVCYVEVEAYLCNLLVEKMQDGTMDPAPVWSDAKSFDGRRWRGTVDCLVAGYPCSPFSKAGKLKQSADPRYLWTDVRRTISECRPPFVFLENVANHLRRGFESVQDDLRSMGYRITAGLFAACEVGCTHYRERLFVLAWSGASDWPILNMGDPNGEGLEGRILHHPDGGGYERPAWPPGPEARADWVDVLAREAYLEPGFCRVADGRPAWVDRIRSLGNGVVPLVAAYAFSTLSDALRLNGRQPAGTEVALGTDRRKRKV